MAASDDLTGAAALGGDWVLERQTGAVETAVLGFSFYQNMLNVNGINLIAIDGKVNSSEVTGVVISGTTSNSGGVVQITVKDSAGNVVNASDVATNSSAWTTTMNLSGLNDGTLTVYAKQSSTTAPLTSGDLATAPTIIKDTTAPDTSITSNPDATTSSTSATFTWSGTDSGTGATGVGSYQYILDSGSWTTTSSTTVTLSGLSTAQHTFQVRAIDVAGNTDATAASYSWTVTGLSLIHI